MGDIFEEASADFAGQGPGRQWKRDLGSIRDGSVYDVIAFPDRWNELRLL